MEATLDLPSLGVSVHIGPSAAPGFGRGMYISLSEGVEEVCPRVWVLARARAHGCAAMGRATCQTAPPPPLLPTRVCGVHGVWMPRGILANSGYPSPAELAFHRQRLG